MANTEIAFQEVRFDVRGDLTHAFVYIENLSRDGMLGVQGWHHKAFPQTTSVRDIMNLWHEGKEDPLMWPLAAPDDRRRKVNEMADRLMGWALPASVCADTCTTDSNYPHQRSGTNLLTVDEARLMFEYVLAGVY